VLVVSAGMNSNFHVFDTLLIIKFFNLDAILSRFVCMEMVIQSTEKINTKDYQFIDLQGHENNHKESDWCSHLHKFVLVLA
jgi:hypothetical protein